MRLSVLLPRSPFALKSWNNEDESHPYKTSFEDSLRTFQTKVKITLKIKDNFLSRIHPHLGKTAALYYFI